MKIIGVCFEKQDSLKIVSIGPIMVHSAIRFIFIDASQIVSFPTSILEDNTLFVIFPYVDEKTCIEDINYFYISVNNEITDWYLGEHTRIELIDKQGDFRDHFLKLPTLHKSLINMNFWNPVNVINRLSTTRDMRNSIRDCYQTYVDIMDYNTHLLNSISSLCENISTNPFFFPLESYFRDQLSDVCNQDFSPMLQGIRFFEEETRSILSGRSALSAALIGAIVASLLYFYLFTIVGSSPN
ncbi:hypothetical protein ACFLU1_04110 [Chloroflexota bacterium]